MNRTALCLLSRMVDERREIFQQIVWPTLIGFVSISLFLFLSYMIIEGYSLSQLVNAVHDVPNIGSFER